MYISPFWLGFVTGAVVGITALIVLAVIFGEKK